MANVFIVHGAYGHPEENWIPWLRSELENMGHKVSVPRFPTPENQNLKNWMEVWKKHDNDMEEDSIMIGHSIGCAFLLHVIENLKRPIRTSFFVSGFADKLNNNFDELNRTFYARFDWNKIKNNCGKFFVFHSDNDPYVPTEKARTLAKNLGADLIIVKNGGHFNEAAGYTRFDKLLETIKREMHK